MERTAILQIIEIWRALYPLYGKKGVGFAKDPVKSVKNRVSHKTTAGVKDILKWLLAAEKNAFWAFYGKICRINYCNFHRRKEQRNDWF